MTLGREKFINATLGNERVNREIVFAKEQEVFDLLPTMVPINE